MTDNMRYSDDLCCSFPALEAARRCAEMASVTEIKADQFEWMANAIRREFGIKDSADSTVSEHSEIRSEN